MRPGPTPAQVALYLPALVIIISVPISWKRFQSSAPCRSTRGACGEGSGVPGRARGGAGDPFGDPPGDASGEAPCRKPSSQPPAQQRAKRGNGEGSRERKLDGETPEGGWEAKRTRRKGKAPVPSDSSKEQAQGLVSPGSARRRDSTGRRGLRGPSPAAAGGPRPPLPPGLPRVKAPDKVRAAPGV